jgi:hypothetical protein
VDRTEVISRLKSEAVTPSTFLLTALFNCKKMQEVWMPVVGYEGLYEVSNLGNVISVKKNIKLKHRHSKGYVRVVLYKNNISKSCLIHRLVGFAFLENENNKPIINHINGIKNDNRLYNLEWCTQSENIIHKFEVLNFKVSQETRNKIGLSRLGKKHSEETKIKMSKPKTKRNQ